MKILPMLIVAAVSLYASAAVPVEEGFRNPPDECRLQVWWHWVDDCVTREGIARDLAAMKSAGISTAYVFSPRMSNLESTATIMSEEWIKLFEYAIAEAKKNGLKLGFHNCPGWSSSGGPWIKPEDSMKTLTAAYIDVSEGLKAAAIAMPTPSSRCDFYRDLAVYAFPILGTPKFARGMVPDLIRLDPEQPSVYELEYVEPFMPTFASFEVQAPSVYFSLKIEADANGRWIECGKRDFELFRDAGGIKSVSLVNTFESRRWRVTFSYRNPPPWVPKRDLPIAKFELGSPPLASGYDAIDADSLVNITDKVKDGCIVPKDVPWLSSRMRILRVGYTTTGQGPAPATVGGLECDKLSRSGLDAHWPNMPAKLLALPGAKDVINSMIIDSYESGDQNWTESMPDEYLRRKQDDIMKSLPALVGYNICSKKSSDKLRGDFAAVVADLYAENYYDYFAELCHKAGVKAITEPYGGPFDPIRCGKETDIPTCEFWLGENLHGSVRQAVKIAEKWNKQIVASESFTTEAKEGRWQITPWQLKRSGDAAWVAGVNQIVMHSYVHQPFTNRVPGCSLGRHGTQLNVNTTWWPEMSVWTDYIRRGQFLLRYGWRGEIGRRFANDRIEGLSRIGDNGELIWFLRNRGKEAVDEKIVLDPEGKRQAHCFQAETGRIIGGFGKDGEAVVELNPGESMFLVFADGIQDDQVRLCSDPRSLDDGWTIVSFEGPGAPKAPMEMPKLTKWNESEDISLKYFSGRARYRRMGTVPSGWLDLGEVHALANIYVDGKKVGCAWCPPFRVQIPAGEVLEVEVVNTWPNRMIGDEILRNSGKEGYTWSNWMGGWSAGDSPLPAGLVGPVRVFPFR